MTDAFSDPPILNLNRLSALLDSGERSELFQLFLESAAETMASLKALSQQDPVDRNGARNELHAFKGACISIGAERLASTVKQLEKQCRDEMHPDILRWLVTLEQGLAELRVKLAPEMKT